MTFNAQEYFDKNLTAEQVKKIDGGFSGEKLGGEVVIRDYPNLEEINLSNHELTSLTISNCPNLKEINVRNNQLTKLELDRAKINDKNEPQPNEIKELILGGNQLETLNLTNCPKINRLMVPDNPLLSKIKRETIFYGHEK